MALFIGLMSGTSMDGVDGVLAQFDAPGQRATSVLAHAHAAMPADLAAELLALNTPAADEIQRGAAATHRLMALYAEVVHTLLRSTSTPPAHVMALGAHGQTVRHRPQAFGDGGYTVQLVNGASLAERTGITTVCDFRSADVAAGGQGAPLVPAFHASCWAEARRDTAVLNVGGIANLTLLHADGRVGGFDTGPGNLLMDLCCQRACGLPYDAGGAIAAGGDVDEALLERLLADRYFAAPAPKSTGRDDFHADWLDRHLPPGVPVPPAADLLATLCELTARSAASALLHSLPGVSALRVCGGGAFNGHLLDRLAAHLPGVRVESTQAVGLPPDQVEALAFAWLAFRRIAGLPGNLPEVTGARGPRVLGAVHLPPPRVQQP